MMALLHRLREGSVPRINAKDQCQGLIAMDETLKDRDQNEDDILVFEVSDDALEVSAGPVGAFPTASIDIIPPNCC
jgi:hypothetical protein